MTLIDFDDASNRRQWPEPQTLADDQIEDWWSKHTAAEAATEIGADQRDDTEGMGAVVVPLVWSLGLVMAGGLAGWIVRGLS